MDGKQGRWQKIKDKDSGRDYYYDPDTGVTSWEAPCVQTDSSATFPSGRTDDEEYDDYDDLYEIPLVSSFQEISLAAASDVDYRAQNALDVHMQESSNSTYFHSSHREEWNDDGTRQGGVAEKSSKREHYEVVVDKAKQQLQMQALSASVAGAGPVCMMQALSASVAGAGPVCICCFCKAKQQMQTEPQVQSCPRPVTIGGPVVGECVSADLEFTHTTDGSAKKVRLPFAPSSGPAPVLDLDTTAGIGLFLLLTCLNLKANTTTFTPNPLQESSIQIF
jgi:hypothetical protein